MKILSETWFCSSEAPHWATSDQSKSTSFLGIRATPGTSDAKACVGVLAVLPSICQKSSMFLHITHWQSCLPSKNIMKCSLYPQISPPSLGGNGKTCLSTHTGFTFVTKKRWKTFKFTQKKNLPRNQDWEFRFIWANLTYQRICWLLVHIYLIFKVR